MRSRHLRTALLLMFVFCISASLAGAAEEALGEAFGLRSKVIELYRQGKYREAIPLAELVLKMNEKEFGPNHPETAQSLNQLALLYKAAGDYAKVEPLYQRALEIYRTSDGPNHPNVGLVLNNMANYYLAIGDHPSAERYYKGALEIFEEKLGLYHEMTLKTLNNIGKCFYSAGDDAHAEFFLNMALKRAEKVLKPDNPLLAALRNDLEVFRRSKVAKAEPEGPAHARGAEKKPDADEADSIKTPSSNPLKTAQLPAGNEPGSDMDVGAAGQVEEKVMPTDEIILPKGMEPPAEQPDVKQTPAVGTAPLTGEKRPLPYSLYLGSFRTPALANRALRIYKEKGLDPYWSKVSLGEKGVWYRVYTGHFSEKGRALEAKAQSGLEEAQVKKTTYANLVQISDSPDELGTSLSILKQRGYCPYTIKHQNGKTYLYVGAFRSRGGAETLYRELKSIGIENQVTER